MSVALGLYRLQQVDSQIDQAQARLRTIHETLENDLTLRAAMDAFSAAEAFHKEASYALKECEAEVEKQSIKIKQSEASLYGGSVRNPKELQDLQMDVASLKKHLVTLEERELEAMMQIEDAEEKLQTAKVKLQSVKSNLKSQNIDLTNESDVLTKELERLESEHNAVNSNIDEKSIKIYNKLRQQKRGVAVSLMSEEACSACGTIFTASQQQNARSTSQLFYCPTCGRIIYSD